MGFVIAALLLMLGVLAILTFPWWRPNRIRDDLTLSGEDLAEELNEDVAVGALAAEDLEPAARDLEATVDRTAAATQRVGARRRWGIGLAALLLVPIAAGVLYWHFGNWRFALQGEHAAIMHRADTMLAQLKAHQREHPGDVQGWINLGQGADALGRFSLAASAYQHAVKLQSKPDPDVLAMWGEALLLAHPNSLTAQERDIFNRVLKLDPDNARGLWYGGLLALNAGDRAEAVADWQRLLQQPHIPSQVAGLIRNHLRMLGVAATAAKPAAAAAGHATSLSVTVKLAPALKADVKPGETLYVFVRGTGGGPPLAVRRLKVGHFPIRLTLSDSDAMMQGHGLSSASGPLQVVAHVSSHGDVAPGPGDLLGSERVAGASDHPSTTVVIDRRLGSGSR